MPATPTTIISDVIELKLPTLSTAQRRFAKFLIENPQRVATTSAGSLGRHLKMSPSTIVRAAAALGYPGYPSLQRALQEQIFARAELIERIEVTGKTPGTATPESIVRESINADIESLRQVQTNIAPNRIEDTVRDILRARRIYISGHGISSVPALHLTTGLRQLGHNALNIAESHSDISFSMHGANHRDLMISISMPRHPRPAVAAVRYARKRRLRCVAITDTPMSPVAQESDSAIYVKHSTLRYFESILPLGTVVSAIISLLAITDNEHARESLRLMESEWLDADWLVDPRSDPTRSD